MIKTIEDILEKGLIQLEKKLNVTFKNQKHKQYQKKKKKSLKKKVKYLHHDLSKQEQKGIVSIYHKHNTQPPKAAYTKRELINEIRYQQRLQELKKLKTRSKNKEQTIHR